MNKLPLTTLCYIENEDSFLMMHRIKKENDINKDKWIGVGGHFEPGESLHSHGGYPLRHPVQRGGTGLGSKIRDPGSESLGGR